MSTLTQKELSEQAANEERSAMAWDIYMALVNSPSHVIDDDGQRAAKIAFQLTDSFLKERWTQATKDP